jgi:hypothetical protein
MTIFLEPGASKYPTDKEIHTSCRDAGFGPEEEAVVFRASDFAAQ